MDAAPAASPQREETGAAPSRDPERRRLRRAWLLSCLAFFLIGAGWALALPVDGTYDESEHLIRAYGAASGQLYSPPAEAARGGGAWFEVPRSLLPGDVHCAWQSEPKRSAACQRAAPDDPATQRIGSTAGRYNPVYYVPVGAPMVLLPNHTGVILARLVSSLLSAMLLASAAVVALRLRSRLMLVAVMLGATPMALNLNGSINPNGLEIAAGVLAWAALLALLRTPDGFFDHATTRRLLTLAAVAASLLLTVRALGPLWLLGITVVCLLAARPGRLTALLRRTDARWLIAGAAAVAAYAVAWLLLSGALQAAPGATPGQERLEDMGRLMVVSRSSFWTDQIIGQFGYGETTLPSWFIVIWYGLVATLVVPAALLAPWRDRIALLGIAIASAFALAFFEVAYYATLNWAQHGRYVMPFGVGLLMYAALAGRYPDALGGEGQSALLRTAALVTAPLQLLALAVVMTRFQVGPGSPLNPLIGEWLPPPGPVAPLLAAAAGGGLVVIMGFLRLSKAE